MDIKQIRADENKFFAMTYNTGLGSGMSPVEYHRWTKIIQQLLGSRRNPSVLPHVIGFYLVEEEPYGCFSNWYDKVDGSFTVDGVTYAHGLQYMMYKKAIILGAKDTAHSILTCTEPRLIKLLGESYIPNDTDAIWDTTSLSVMRRGLRAKFSQNPRLKEILLSTGSAILAECTDQNHLNGKGKVDHKWGIGLTADDWDAQLPEKWKGCNRMGYTLMQVRSDIRAMDDGVPEENLDSIPSTNAIKVIQGDITKIQADAIVNAANKRLLGGGGVDGAIHRAAGPELLQECDTLCGCETGDVRLTKAYNLPAQYVFHTPGPVWHGGLRGEAGKLANCWRRSLTLAVDLGLHSIAFPSISTGVYGYPLDQAAKVAMETTMEFLQNNPDAGLSVIVVAFASDVVLAYTKALHVLQRV